MFVGRARMADDNSVGHTGNGGPVPYHVVLSNNNHRRAKHQMKTTASIDETDSIQADSWMTSSVNEFNNDETLGAPPLYPNVRHCWVNSIHASPGDPACLPSSLHDIPFSTSDVESMLFSHPATHFIGEECTNLLVTLPGGRGDDQSNSSSSQSPWYGSRSSPGTDSFGKSIDDELGVKRIQLPPRLSAAQERLVRLATAETISEDTEDCDTNQNWTNHDDDDDYGCECSERIVINVSGMRFETQVSRVGCMHV